MRSSPPRSAAMTPARSRWPHRCWSGCGPACCAWPTAASSASSCGRRRRPAVARQVQPEVSMRQAPARRLVPELPAALVRRAHAVVVRLIEYRLDGVPDAEPLYRLITSLLDPESAPAAELAALYHERWEEEGAFAELKVTLPGGQLMLRSRRADLAEQELYALLLVHLALRGLMVQASRQGGCDPDTLSFIHTVRVVRRHLPFHAAFPPSAAPTHG